MQLSKTILHGVLLGLSAISVTGATATDQKPEKIPAKGQQPQDTARQINCVKYNPALSPEYRPYAAPGDRLSVPATDSARWMHKEPCVTCGRG